MASVGDHNYKKLAYLEMLLVKASLKDMLTLILSQKMMHWSCHCIVGIAAQKFLTLLHPETQKSI